jgi:hypothetical protein
MGFVKSTRDGVYQRTLDSECLMYFMCRPRTRSGCLVLQPLIAIENLRLRRLIGKTEAKQQEPRIAHVYLSYTIDEPITFWSFSDADGMKHAIDAIDRALQAGGIPFAQRWTPFRAAVELLRRGFSGDLPQGVFTHPTLATRGVLEALPDSTELVSSPRVAAKRRGDSQPLDELLTAHEIRLAADWRHGRNRAMFVDALARLDDPRAKATGRREHSDQARVSKHSLLVVRHQPPRVLFRPGLIHQSFGPGRVPVANAKQAWRETQAAAGSAAPSTRIRPARSMPTRYVAHGGG